MNNITQIRPIPFLTAGSSRNVTAAAWYPVPGVYDTTRLDQVQFFLYLTTEPPTGVDPSITNHGAEVAVGAQYSNDGINWGTAETELGILAQYNGTAAWVSTIGRNEVGVPADLPGGFQRRNDSTSGTALANNRLFVRFGVFVRNQSGVTGIRSGTVALGVITRTLEAGTVAGGPVLCMSGGKPSSLQVSIDTPLTPAIPAENVAEFRATLDIVANLGVEITLVQFESDDNAQTWTVHAMQASPTVYSAEGLTYPTAFVALNTALTKPQVRFGVRVINDGSQTDYLSAVVSLRVDWRAS